MTERARRIPDWVVIALLALIATIPVLLVDLVPLTDLAGHIGRYAVQVDGGASADLRAWYGFHWALLGNLGCDLVVQGLAPLLGLEPAVKATMAMIVALHVTGVLALSRAAHGRIAPTALFALPLVYGFPLHFGFVNFALSIGLALVLLALWLEMGKAGHYRLRAVAFVPLGFVLWLCHMVGLGVFGVAILADGLVRERDGQRPWPAALLRAGLGALPAAIGPIAAMLAAPRGAPQELFDYSLASAKLLWPFMALRDMWHGWDIGAVLALVVLAYLFWRTKAFVRHSGLALAALLLTGVYAVMPNTILGSVYADMRLVPVILTLFLVAAAPAPSAPRWLGPALLAGGLIFSGARLAGNAVSMVRYEAKLQRSLTVLDAVPRGADMVTLFITRCGAETPWKLDRRDHLSGYALVRRHAFDSNQWQMPSGQLLSIHNAAARPFEHSPYPQMFDRDCDVGPGLPRLMGEVGPAIDLVWVIGLPDGFALPGWTRVRAVDDSVLLRRK